jgi:hypothetical protein
MILPSWNDTPTKHAILDFVTATSDEGSTDYIPPTDRIAAFDNDGTLWVEQPAPAQTGLLIGKLVEMVKVNPSLAEEEPFKSIINQDPAFLHALAQQVPEAVIYALRHDPHAGHLLCLRQPNRLPDELNGTGSG